MNGVGTRGNASGGSSWGAAAVCFLLSSVSVFLGVLLAVFCWFLFGSWCCLLLKPLL